MSERVYALGTREVFPSRRTPQRTETRTPRHAQTQPHTSGRSHGHGAHASTLTSVLATRPNTHALTHQLRHTTTPTPRPPFPSPYRCPLHSSPRLPGSLFLDVVPASAVVEQPCRCSPAHRPHVHPHQPKLTAALSCGSILSCPVLSPGGLASVSNTSHRGTFFLPIHSFLSPCDSVPISPRRRCSLCYPSTVSLWNPDFARECVLPHGGPQTR